MNTILSMVKEKTKIGISLRVLEETKYIEKRDGLSQEWPIFLESLNFIPVFIPNSIVDVKSFLDQMNVKGLILSGGDNIGDNLERDNTEKEILEYGIKEKIPVLGICRGMQIMNDFFGGKITKTDNLKHVNKNHLVNILDSKIKDSLKTDVMEVNSYHNNIILDEYLGKELSAIIFSKTDNTIEGFIHKELPIMGIMWHPERDQNANNKLILKNFFNNIF